MKKTINKTFSIPKSTAARLENTIDICKRVGIAPSRSKLVSRGIELACDEYMEKARLLSR